MGINYTQFCIFGIELGDCKQVLAEAIYEEQPRYDIKTGKQTHTERVLVKQEEITYKALEESADCIDDLATKLAHKYKLKTFINYEQNEILYVGFLLGTSVDFGRVELLEGFVEELPESIDLPGNLPWRIYFIACVG